MERRIRLHIGTHRTGTTSLQRLLHEHHDLLAASGVAYPPGRVFPESHNELAWTVLRPDRVDDLAPFADFALRALGNELTDARDPRWRDGLAAELAATGDADVVLSAEGLWWVRHPDEVARLLDVLGPARVDVVCALRHPAEFLESYRWMASFMHRGTPPPASMWYCEPDSWLVDYARQLETWRSADGIASVRVVSYTAAVERDGSVLPAVLRALDLPDGVTDTLVRRSAERRENSR